MASLVESLSSHVMNVSEASLAWLSWGFVGGVFLCWGSETPIIALARQKPVYLSAKIVISCSHVYYHWTLTWKVVTGEGLLKIRACVDLLTKWELAMSVDYMTILALKNTGFWRANAIIGVSHPQHTKKTQPPAKTQQKNSQASHWLCFN